MQTGQDTLNHEHDQMLGSSMRDTKQSQRTCLLAVLVARRHQASVV